MKKKIAIITGGDSGEYEISIQSSENIAKSIDTNLYEPYLIIITGKIWVYRNQNGAETPVDKNDFSIIENGEKIFFDCALITIHGTPGEDGKLQGYFDILKIPYTSSGRLQSALTFNKYFANQIVSHWGFPVAKNIRIKKGDDVSEEAITKNIDLPVFVKPNRGGSSLGTDKADDYASLIKNINIALELDDEVLIEEFICGKELTCGVLKYNEEIIAFPLTEIVPKDGSKFFDFNAKYKKQSDEITPARISEELTKKIQETSKFLYKKFELSGLVRFDYIYSGKIIYFLEVNTIPGMTDESLVPQQANAAGISYTKLFTMVIEEAMKRSDFA